MNDSGNLDSMVYRIVAFQLHQHAIWNEALSFEERVNSLPLYALEFNNHDRDSSKHGPTIAHYAPAKQEMVALTRIFEGLGSNLKILDIGCGNGFIGSLLAREGIPIVGIDDCSWKPPQIPRLFDKQVYELRAPESFEKFEGSFNVAFCSWMVPNSNLTPQIVARRPDFIVHVFSPFKQNDGSLETGCIDAYLCPPEYRVLGAWKAITPNNFFADIDNRLSSKGPSIRITEVWIRCDLHNVKFYAPEFYNKGYYWDDERETLNKIRLSKNMQDFQIRICKGR